MFIYSCRKPVPESTSPSAIFFIKGTMDGEIVNLQAGDNDIYMSPSYEDDSLSIRSYVGRIGDLDCVDADNCPGSFKISIREKERSQNQVRPISQNIYVSKFNLRGPVQFLFNSYKATFTSRSTPIGSSHFWDFGDGFTSTEESPTHTYVRKHDSIVTPKLEVSSNSGCSSSLSYKLEFKQPCDVDFFPSLNQGVLSWSTSPNHNRKELWDLSHGYLPLGPGNLIPTDSVFKACIKSLDTLTGCVSYKCKNIILDTNVVGCVANFDVVKEAVVIEDNRDYSEVSIRWVSSSGMVYNSDSFDQPSTSWFEITSVESYVNDKNGFPTKKITVAFSLRLYGADINDYKEFESEKSVIAISY